jgi:hypothetical protein
LGLVIGWAVIGSGVGSLVCGAGKGKIPSRWVFPSLSKVTVWDRPEASTTMACRPGSPSSRTSSPSGLSSRRKVVCRGIGRETSTSRAASSATPQMTKAIKPPTRPTTHGPSSGLVGRRLRALPIELRRKCLRQRPLQKIPCGVDWVHLSHNQQPQERQRWFAS